MRKNISDKIILFVSLILLTAIVILNIAMVIRFIGFSNSLVEETLYTRIKALEDYIDRSLTFSNEAALLMSYNAEAIKAIEEKDTPEVLRLFTGALSKYGVSYFTITDNKGIVLGRTHQPDNYGDSIADQVNVINALRGEVSSYFEPGRYVKVSVRTGVPVYDADGAIAGVIIAGVRFDDETKIRDLQELFDSEISVFLGDTRIVTTITTEDGQSAVGTTLDPNVSRVLYKESRAFNGTVEIFGRSFAAYYKPILNMHGDAFAAIFVGVSIDRLTSESNKMLIELVVIGIMVLILSILFLTAYIKIRRTERISEAANQAKSQFLAIMSHEIRTPMNSIMGFAELAFSMATDFQVKEYLKKIVDSTKWLLHIINDILDISKIESGKMELENIPFDLEEVVARCHSVILPVVTDKELELRLYAEPTHGRILMGDPVRLYQVLLNLLSNAVKFTDKGLIKFSSLVRNIDENSATLYFEIKDNGIGMTKEELSKIFNSFTQADTSTTRKYGGTGLGLSITKSLIEMMGGELVVKSAPGEGSSFSFEIIFKTTEDTESMSHFELSAMIEKPLFKGLVLVCDDNPMNHQVMSDHLSQVGLQVIAVENGKLGLEKVKQRMDANEPPFELILMDVFMPVMDGIEAADEIAKLNTGTPIVAVTANIMTSEIERYKEHNMPDHLGKPFTTQELWRLLLRYLKPVSVESIDQDDYNKSKNEMLDNLRLNFIKSYRNTFTDIKEALNTGDRKQAHRLAHSLKGNAGQINKTELAYAARVVEDMLKNENIPIQEDDLSKLEIELDLVLGELMPLLEEIENEHKTSDIKPPDIQEVSALFKNLEPMLKTNDSDCDMYLDDLRKITGTEELTQFIETYDLKQAYKTLIGLKEKWGLNNE